MSLTLSIIIPSFQAAGTIARALASIASQRFKDFEVLIMDGGSTDGTSALVSSQYPEAQFFSERDKGIYDAMNKGIDKASGEWLYFMGSDDVLTDDMVLERVFSLQDIRDYDVLYGQVLMEDSRQLYLGEFDARKLVFKNISHQAIFTRREVFTKHGKFDLKYKICADHIFNVKWFFDTSIRKKYIGQVIATFGESGISSRMDDIDKVRDLPGMVRKYAGFPLYFNFYIIRPPWVWVRKKIQLCKRLLLRFVPIII